MKLPESLWFYPFKPSAVLRVTGDDALTFLQGQFTQELRSSIDRFLAYGLWLNQKGRVIADSFAIKEAEKAWWLVSKGSTAQVICERLEAYIIADDVVIEDATVSWGGVVLGGTGAEAWLAAQAGTLPERGRFTRSRDGFLFQGRISGDWEWVMPTASAGELVELLKSAGASLLGYEQRESQRIRAGIPAVPCDVGLQDLPNEAGLDQEAISYTKGCYLGQEVMARLKAMGKVRRRLLRVRGEGDYPRELPAALFARGKKIGELRSAVKIENGFVGLAMISLLGLDRESGLAFANDGAARAFVDTWPI